MQVTVQTKKVATRDAYGEALVEWGKKEPRLVVLDADLSKSTKTAGFAKAFPERFFQMGIAEQDMMGTAGGLALAGKIAFASSFAVFATGRAYEQIRNSIAYPRLNVKIAATHAGITVGEDGSSHQALEDIALMRVIPNMTVIVPADAVATRWAVGAAIAHDGPVYIRMGREAIPLLYPEDYPFELGKVNVLRSSRRDAVTIIACGVMVAPALQAADSLAQEGLAVRVLDLHTIKPLDVEAIARAARETGRIVTVEEHNTLGGMGGAVAEAVTDTYPVPVRRLGTGDRFGQSGKPADLLAAYRLTVADIRAAVQEALVK